MRIHRHFLVVSRTGRTSLDFPPKGYAGHSGRLDIVARSMAAAFSSEEFLERTEFTAVLLGPPSPPLVITVRGRLLRGPMTLESHGQKVLFDALRGAADSYVDVIRQDPLEYARHLLSERRYAPVILSETGVPARPFFEALRDGARLAFLLGTREDPPEEFVELFKRMGAVALSYPGGRYFASQCVFYTQYLIRRAEVGARVAWALAGFGRRGAAGT